MGTSPETTSWSFRLWCTWQSLKGMNFRHLPTSNVDLRGKLVLITGANNGIGRKAALQFARYGADVLLACREPPPREQHPDIVVEQCKGAALEAGHERSAFEWWQCDMADFASVEAFAKRLWKSGRSLDILCNNAGIAGSSRERRAFTKDGNEIIHQVDFLSHVLLTMYLLPSLATAPEPRIIFTTSCMQYFGVAKNP